MPRINVRTGEKPADGPVSTRSAQCPRQESNLRTRFRKRRGECVEAAYLQRAAAKVFSAWMYGRVVGTVNTPKGSCASSGLDCDQDWGRRVASGRGEKNPAAGRQEQHREPLPARRLQTVSRRYPID